MRRQAQFDFDGAARRHIDQAQAADRPAERHRLIGATGTFQTHPQQRPLTDECSGGSARLQDQAGKIAPGMQDGDEIQRPEQKGQAVGQAVLVVDRGQQHQQQCHQERQADRCGHDEDALLVQAHAGSGRDAP